MREMVKMTGFSEIDGLTLRSGLPLPGAGGDLAARVARIPGARFLPARPGGFPAILIDDADGAPDGEPTWLAVASAGDSAQALQLGATGVVPPGIEYPALSAAISAARRGLAVLPPEALARLIPGHVAPVTREPNCRGPSLTPREQAVLQLLSEGATNKMIARALDISVHTAKFHVASILGKLDAITRTDAVAQGVRQGFLML